VLEPTCDSLSPVNLRAIIFDFGGVVIHWDPRRVYRRFLQTDEAIDRFFHEVGFHRWNANQDRGAMTWDEAVAELSSRFPHHRELIMAPSQLESDLRRLGALQ